MISFSLKLKVISRKKTQRKNFSYVNDLSNFNTTENGINEKRHVRKKIKVLVFLPYDLD